MLVRTDIPLADQVVQVGHACLEAGRRFVWQDGTHMVVLAVPDLERLLRALERLDRAGTRYALFDEPDDQMGFTAACTEPVQTCPALKGYKLWR